MLKKILIAYLTVILSVIWMLTVTADMNVISYLLLSMIILLLLRHIGIIAIKNF
jgi:hypothetical protein